MLRSSMRRVPTPFVSCSSNAHFAGGVCVPYAAVRQHTNNSSSSDNIAASQHVTVETRLAALEKRVAEPAENGTMLQRFKRYILSRTTARIRPADEERLEVSDSDDRIQSCDDRIQSRSQVLRQLDDRARFEELTKVEIQDRCTDLGFCKVVGFDLRCHNVDAEGKLQATEQVMDVAALICGGDDPSAATNVPMSGIGVATERALCLGGCDGVLAGVDGNMLVTFRECIEDTETGKVSQSVEAETVTKHQWAAPRLKEVWLRDTAPNTHRICRDIAVLRFESPLFPDKDLQKAPLRVRSPRRGEELCAVTRTVIHKTHDMRLKWDNTTLVCSYEGEHVSSMREGLFPESRLGTAAWSATGELVAICAEVESRYYR